MALIFQTCRSYNEPMAKHPGGRPTKYNAQFHPKMAKLAAAVGGTNESIATELGISLGTLQTWKEKYPEFLTAINQAKKGPDDIVEESLYRKALGYTKKLKKQIAIPVGNGMGSEIQEVTYDQHVPADTTAQIFWLKNRRPEKWRDKVEQHHSGEITLNQMTPEERKARIKALKAKHGAD